MSISLSGPVVEDLKAHFVQRWNFIYNEKYDVRKDVRYSRLDYKESRVGIVHSSHGPQPGDGSQEPLPAHMRDIVRERIEEGRGRFEDGKEEVREQFGSGAYSRSLHGGISCQIMRSCCKWSHGVAIEHSIANAYINIIKNSDHFVYIENQFFITATVDEQRPIKNKIGAAIAERIIRAAKNGENYKMIIAMPAIPAFAGDLKAEDALSTRAIMEFQYNSINRGGHSIIETIAREGIDPMQYIRFYNLRNYDRINSSAAMQEAEQHSGVAYDDARRGYDQRYAAESEGQPQADTLYKDKQHQEHDYTQFQEATQQVATHQGLGNGRWDTVAECYMLGGTDIRNVPWGNGETSEIDAFVSEELYIHSKLLIADDRIVICGSANLNDRSQLGNHDSEIAICIQDSHEIDSIMAGRPWKATRFAASLRRQLFRKHLGLLKPQDCTKPDQNFEPIDHSGNAYDWNSREDALVVDPLGNDFLTLWNSTARTNTDCFEQVFHPVPTDKVRSWKDYDAYYERFFAEAKDAKAQKGKNPEKPSTWKWGHVVAEEFSPGAQGVMEVKEVLSRIRGTLVEMPLLFLKDEDIAKESLFSTLNDFTEEVYT